MSIWEKMSIHTNFVSLGYGDGFCYLSICDIESIEIINMKNILLRKLEGIEKEFCIRIVMRSGTEHNFEFETKEECVDFFNKIKDAIFFQFN